MKFLFCFLMESTTSRNPGSWMVPNHETYMKIGRIFSDSGPECRFMVPVHGTVMLVSGRVISFAEIFISSTLHRQNWVPPQPAASIVPRSPSLHSVSWPKSLGVYVAWTFFRRFGHNFTIRQGVFTQIVGRRFFSSLFFFEWDSLPVRGVKPKIVDSQSPCAPRWG